MHGALEDLHTHMNWAEYMLDRVCALNLTDGQELRLEDRDNEESMDGWTSLAVTF